MGAGGALPPFVPVDRLRERRDRFDRAEVTSRVSARDVVGHIPQLGDLASGHAWPGGQFGRVPGLVLYKLGSLCVFLLRRTI